MTDAHHAKAETLHAAVALRLRPAGGARDAALFDAATDADGSRAQRTSALIECGFAPAPGDKAGDEARAGWAAAMSIADRQIALVRLALDHGHWPAWFVTPCTACGALIDVRVGADEFPVTAAPGPVPAFVTVDGPRGPDLFRVPAAAEEAGLEDDPDADLLTLCHVSGDAAVPEAAFEAALTAVLPGFDAELRFSCPDCGEITGWWFDPLDWIARHAGRCFSDVDALARRYGWSEAAILAMPEARRRIYLAMIGDES